MSGKGCFLSRRHTTMMLACGAMLLALLAVPGVTSASPPSLPTELNWSVQYLIDQSQTVLGKDQFSSPRDNRGLALSPDGRYAYLGYNNGPEVRKIDLAVSDYTDATVERITSSRGKAIAVDDMGRVYLAEGTVKIFDGDLAVQQLVVPTVKCEGVAVVREGTDLVLYTSDRSAATLTRWVLTEDGDVVTAAVKAGLDGDGVINVSGASDLRGVAVDSSDRIWIADNVGHIFRVNNDSTGLVSTDAVADPYAIAFSGTQALVTGGDERTIVVLDKETLVSEGTITPPWADLALDPDAGAYLSGIAVDPAGTGFYVANEGGQTANEHSTYGRVDAQSGYIGDVYYTDMTNDDNEPLLHALFPLPKQLKEAAREQLAGISSDEKKIEEQIDKAIKHLDRSLDEDLWSDDAHLDSRHGGRVFVEEKEAVKALLKLIDRKDVPAAIEDTCRAVIDQLCAIDSTLAEAAIDQAQAYGDEPKVAKELRKANEDISKALEELTKGKPDNAIEYYEHAWEHAQEAIEHAAKV